MSNDSFYSNPLSPKATPYETRFRGTKMVKYYWIVPLKRGNSS